MGDGQDAGGDGGTHGRGGGDREALMPTARPSERCG
jgi:hypothetical protein